MTGDEDVASDRVATPAPDDDAGPNGQAVARAAALARLAGTGMVLVGVLAMVGWAWLVFRAQRRMDGAVATSLYVPGTDLVGTSSGIELADRVDIVANTFTLAVLGASAVGLGLMLRLLAEYTVARSGRP